MRPDDLETLCRSGDAEALRFWSKVGISENGCWVWLAGCDKRGRGRFYFRKRVSTAVTVAYILACGPIEHEVVQHTCSNRRCLNPSHLVLVSPSTEDVFWSYVDKTAECWVWRGHRDRLGYGKCTNNGKKDLAHRVSYALVNGPIPKGRDIHHTCENPSCVNPVHLMALSRREHVVNFSPNAPAYRNARVTHCPSGHEYTQENTRIYRNGRYCRACYGPKVRERGVVG